jgi:nitrate reductase gamma subunit
MPPLTIALIATISVFLLGNLCRVVKTMRMPVHLRWDLYPIPKGPHDRQRYGGSYFEETEWWTKPVDTGRGGEAAFMLKEVLFLRGVFENFRALWAWSLALHWGLYLYMASAATAVAVSAFGDHLVFERAFFSNAAFAGFVAACSLGVIGSLGLLATRMFNSRLKGFTTRATVFNLCLLAAIFATGLVALFHPNRGLLVTLADVVAGRHVTGTYSSAIVCHFALVAFFLAYFPFTHMTHMYMKYFTWHGARWNDLPARFDKGGSAALAANLARRVSWQAPHIHSTAEQSWADVASSTGQQDGQQDEQQKNTDHD